MPKFIADWRKSWRFHSVQAAVILALLSTFQAQVLPGVEPLVPPKYWPWVTLGFAALIWFFRILAQTELDEAPKQ